MHSKPVNDCICYSIKFAKINVVEKLKHGIYVTIVCFNYPSTFFEKLGFVNGLSDELSLVQVELARNE